MLKSSVLTKYYDCSIVVNDINKNQKEFKAHKLLLSNFSEYFENLFDFENKDTYTIYIPFDINIFISIYNKIYQIKNDQIQKDLNYYENKLYALYFLSYNQKDIYKLLNNIILEVDSNYPNLDITQFKKNLNDFNLIPPDTKNDLINRICLDTFIENYYDKNSKKLVLTDHLMRKNFNIEYIDIEDLRFSVYHTDRYDMDQIGFWIDYKKNLEYQGEKTITTATGKLIIYNGIKIIKHKLKKLSRDDRNTLTFEKDKGRFGVVEEYVSKEYNNIDQRICAYKIIIQLN